MALSATIGLGNIAGVAVAIQHGGPGAVFWMILVGFLGMATKFSECSLSVMYRTIDSQGTVHGGPMYYIVKGMGSRFKFLAIFFAIACICSSLGAGNLFQSNQVSQALHESFRIPPVATGLTLSFLTAIVIIGGVKRIAFITSKIVPFMGLFYLLGALTVIFANIREVPHLFYQIFHDAFSGSAAFGGFVGIGLREVVVQGIRRACFSNEAGLGSSAIAHSAAATKEPIREGVVALLEPFIDTILICTMTALVILLSGAWTNDKFEGINLTTHAFNSIIPGFGQYFIPIAVFFFAYSTLLSWSYYGERASDFLWKEKGVKVYKITFCILVCLGALWKINPILNFSDIMFGLMAIPNFIALLFLLPKLKKASENYFRKIKKQL